VGISSGPFEILIRLFCHSNDELYEFLSKEIGRISGVKGMETMIQLKVIKRTFAWLLPEDEASEVSSTQSVTK
jgi:DNA-binding Lrp family transcriptional regulator